MSETKLISAGAPLTSHPAVDAHTASSPSIWRHIWQDVLLLGAGSIGVVFAQLFFRIILIAALVPTAYGRLSLVLGIYNTVWIIGTSGLPNSVARYIAINDPVDDPAIVRSAIRAAIWPTLVAAIVMATVSAVILDSPLACLFSAVGLSSLVYSLLTMGILRGRGRIGSAASIMPVAAFAGVAPLAVLQLSGIGITPLSAFGVFCLGNVIGLIVGIILTLRTAPSSASSTGLSAGKVPNARQLLGFSLWLAAATVGITLLPLALRLAAALDSYTLVAIIDVVLILFTIPQRLGTIIVFAVTPRASRAIRQNKPDLMISRRGHFIAVVPFVLVAAIVAFTPIIGLLFDALGRPEYQASAKYLALVLLAGPARILYGVVEGVLVAHGQGRFLAFTALSITAVASGAIFSAAALGYMTVAFAVFVASFWIIYLVGLARVDRLASSSQAVVNPSASYTTV